MSSLIWTAVSGVLALEILILIGLCAPLPWGVRKNISRFLWRINLQRRLNAALQYILFGLCMAFTESVYSMRKVYMKSVESTDGGSSSQNEASLNLVALNEHRWLKARAERNVYLAGFAITAMLAITRLVHLASIEVQLRNKIKEYNGNKSITETGELEESVKND